MRAIREEMDVEEFYECEIHEMLDKSRIALRRKQLQQALAEEEVENDEEAIREEEVGSNDGEAEPEEEEINMAEFFDTCKVSGPIELPDAFFGGRTGPNVLYASTEGTNKVIRYRDVNSLYPFTYVIIFNVYIICVIYFRNFKEEYPITHPELHIYDQAVEWTEPEDMADDTGHPIGGIIKCDVLPPRHPVLDVPVLPMRVNGRLHFSLCRSCSLEHGTNGKRFHEYSCPHYEPKDRGG